MSKEMGNSQLPGVHYTLEQHRLNPVPPEILDAEPVGPDAPTALNVNFEELLRVQRELTEIEIMDRNEILLALIDLDFRGRLDSFYSNVIERIRNETNLFHEYEEAGIFSFVLNGSADEQFSGIGIEWKSDLLPGQGAVFDILGKKILIRSSLSKKDIILSFLAEYGELTPEINSLLHEVTHFFQWKEQMLSKDPRGFPYFYAKLKKKIYQELEEVQAYRNSESVGEFTVPTRLDLVKRIEEAKTPKGDLLYPGVDREKLIYAVVAIDQLRALGFSIQEIGRIIAEAGRWDEEKGTYPVIEEIVYRKRLELGLNERDLENLVLADRIERNIDRLRTRLIVQEELKSATRAGCLTNLLRILILRGLDSNSEEKSELNAALQE